MKKKSILVSLVVAILAAMTFVGCSDSVVYPKTITGAEITQTGDFLTGQAFDSNKFEVTVTYLDGSTSTTSGSVVLHSSEPGYVVDGSYVTYTAEDFKGNEIYRELTVSVSSIKSLSVSGPETYVTGTKEINKADLTVTATYLDRNNAEATMVLAPEEFKVADIAEKATAANPSVETSVAVTSEVGGKVVGDYAFTVIYEEPVEVPYEVTGFAPLNGQEYAVKYSGSLLAINYGEVPTPDPELAELWVACNDEVNRWISASDIEGVSLEFIYSDGYPLSMYDLRASADKDIFVRATLGNESKDAAKFKITGATLSVTQKQGFVITEGQVLGTASADNFRVVLNGTILDSNEIEVAYTDAAGAAFTATDKAIIGGIYIQVTYMDNVFKPVLVTVSTNTAKPVSVTDIVLGDITAPAKQYYTSDAAWANAYAIENTAIESYTVVMSDGSEISSEEAGGSISVAYYLDNAGTKALADVEAINYGDAGYNAAYAKAVQGSYIDALADVDQVYVQVKFTDDAKNTAVGYQSVKLEPAVANDIQISVSYENEKSSTPMFNSKINYIIQSVNANGVVDPEFKDIEVEGPNNLPVASLPENVGASGANYTVYAYLPTDVDGIVAKTGDKTVSIKAGADYIIATNATVSLKEGEIALIGSKLSDIEGRFAVTGFTHANPAATTQAAAPTFDFLVSGNRVVDANNTILAEITYTDETGNTAKKQVSVTFSGVAYTSISDASLKLSLADHPEVGEGKIVAGTYNLSAFSVDKTTVTEHGNDTNLRVVGYYYNQNTWDGTESTLTTDGNLATTGATYVFVVRYTNASGEVAYAKTNLTVVAEA